MANQGLLLMLSLVLFACSTIPTCISARSVDAMRSEMKTETDGIVPQGLYNGCYQNHHAIIDTDLFCCIKDKLCWPTLQECMPNCPCKQNCGGKKKNNPDEASSPPPPFVVHG